MEVLRIQFFLHLILWRVAPNNVELKVTPPNDTTISYSDSVNILKENLGKPQIYTNLKLGKDIDFQGKEEYSPNRIVGEHFIKETKSIEDTIWISKKEFKVKVKYLEELVERNTLYNALYPYPNEGEF